MFFVRLTHSMQMKLEYHMFKITAKCFYRIKTRELADIRRGDLGLTGVTSLNVTGQVTHLFPSWVFHRANMASRLIIFTPPMAITVFKICVDERWHFSCLVTLNYSSPENSVLLILVDKSVMRTFKLLVRERNNAVYVLHHTKLPYYTFLRDLPRRQ